VAYGGGITIAGLVSGLAAVCVGYVGCQDAGPDPALQLCHQAESQVTESITAKRLVSALDALNVARGRCAAFPEEGAKIASLEQAVTVARGTTIGAPAMVPVPQPVARPVMPATASPACQECERSRRACLTDVRAGHLVDGTEVFADPAAASIDACVMAFMSCTQEHACPR
jgi:hypothetical protein